MKKIVCIICSLVLISIGTLTSIASSQSDLDQINKKIDETSTELNGVKSQMSETMQQVSDLITQISNYENEIATLEMEIEQIEEQLVQKEAELKKAQEDCDQQEEDLKARLIVLYEAGETSYMDVLLGSSSLTDFISNYYMIEQLAVYDTELLESLEEAKNEVEVAKQEIENQKAEVEKAKAEKEAINNQLIASKMEKDSYAAQLSEEESALQRQLEEYEADKQRIEDEIRRATQNDDNVVYAGGELAWPVPSCTYITCGFGDYSGHTGMDIGANTGSTIVAANDGVVTTSVALRNPDGSYRSYGEYIIINHGGGIVTLYAHGYPGSRKVQVGDTVTRGQAIMQVGSTGNSTGAHLHFEVRVNSRAVNPMNYFN